MPVTTSRDSVDQVLDNIYLEDASAIDLYHFPYEISWFTNCQNYCNSFKICYKKLLIYGECWFYVINGS